MRLSVFFCISLTFLGCLIAYISYKLPEYFRKEKQKEWDEQTEGLGVVGSKNTSYSDGAMVTLEEAIRRAEASERKDNIMSDKTLFRKRRFLIFPEGSSFQLVFCLTYFTRIPLADIFYMGATASLAWELPQDPYSPFDHKADPLHRKDKGPVTYVANAKGSQKMHNWGNRVLINRFTGEAIQPFAKEYYNKHYLNIGEENKLDATNKKVYGRKGKHKKVIKPVFAKRSINDRNENGSRIIEKVDDVNAKSIENVDVKKFNSSRIDNYVDDGNGDKSTLIKNVDDEIKNGSKIIKMVDDRRGNESSIVDGDIIRNERNDDTKGNRESKKRKRKKRAVVRPADIDAMHREQEARKYLSSNHMDKNVIDFHRTSRYGLYEKLEKLIIGIGSNGKECLLKALCEVGQDLNGKQGTFLQEILRVVFTLPKGNRYHAKYKHYDEAHTEKYKCEDVYSKCSFSIKSFAMV